MTEEILYAIAFTMLSSFNERQRKNIFEFYGSALAIYKQRENKNSAFSNLELVQKNILLGPWPLKEAGSELNFIMKHNINCITLKDKLYPNRLLHCDDAPTLLYIKGKENFNLPYLISVVGTRQHTVQVNRIINELMNGLCHLNIGIISGMALGVDALAHQAALAYKIPTWGILAHGLDQIYPMEHRKLAIDVMQNGGLITESRKESIILPYCFPKRNRIVAGLSDATIVIETAIKGGSMITANLAFDYNREVFAVPGKIHDSKSKGCLALIKRNKAHLYHDVENLLEQMGWPLAEQNSPQKELEFTFSPDSKRVLAHIEAHGPIHRELIANQLKINASMLSNLLLSLEMKGQIQLLSGNRYALC
ncbi:MAG: DNA-protecting protein DprA [Chitinophagia bacterium]|nr:DNA-protecting protein DprA [Chitinophagia bacterium]